MKVISLICSLLFVLPLAQANEKLNPDSLSDEAKIQIVSTLIKNQGTIFSDADEKRGCPKGETVGSYLSRLLIFGSQGDKHSLKVACEKYSSKTSQLPAPAKKSQTRDCKISAYTSDKAGDSPWHYEIVFRINSDFKSIETAHLACPGAS
jgi:hypothetical protein